MTFRLHDVFSNHMVLQRDRIISVSGTAEPGRAVYVSYAHQQNTARVGSNGAWVVKIGPFPVICTGSVFTAGYVENATFHEEIRLVDVLTGDVWFGSGQSNMEMGITMAENGIKETKNSRLPFVRYLLLNKTSSAIPTNKVDAKWKMTEPEHIGSDGWGGFSAIGYYFSKKLYENIEIPIGFIQSAFGGSRIHPWIRPDILNKYDSLFRYYKEWSLAQEEHRKNPKLEHPFSPYTEYDNHKPGCLYNAMVYPFIRFPVKGVLWYQGESNIGDGPLFARHLEAVAESFRKSWQDIRLPFFFAQIAPYAYDDPDLLPKLWEAQYEAADSIVNSGLAITADCGDVNDIHPTKKKPVGERFADLALNKTYGRYASQRYTCAVTAEKEAGSIRVLFGSGVELKKRNNITLFEIEDDTGKRLSVKAEMRGKTVTVFVPEGLEPAYVLYAWRGDIPFLELYCVDNQPIRPFRVKCK